MSEETMADISHEAPHGDGEHNTVFQRGLKPEEEGEEEEEE